ncbi:mucin-12-like [Oppia nitens]|uniref:mucin-12-like n=1 Tax=Oppia nitens TaxID=1686743 RepID=UPI0023DAC5E7|nr:mucin-12-like [Oppia nitens]
MSISMTYNFDSLKSTKGASKLRRDLINSEIANLRDLLPLPSSTRQRLSQLQLMALVCVYVRKANYFQHAFRKHDLTPEIPMPHFGFSKALSGFLMMTTQNGKLLYISDNAAEYLGHSMEDLLIHGDSVYDIIEKQDHQTIQSELMRTPNPLSLAPDTRIFLCRMNVSRNARRQMRFGDQKVVLIQGHFVSFLPLCSRNEPVFLATCTPVAMPETRECVVQGSTNVFTSIHSMDMKFIHLDRNGEFHLGYNKASVQGLSWYDFVHWEHLRDAQSKHRLITQSEQERSCILLLRLQTNANTWIWVHVVLQVKDSNDSSQQPVIVCTNQVLSEKEATVMRANSWLYQFYSLHSKMHYGLAYEAHTTRLPTYYPTPAPGVMSHAYHHHHHHHSHASPVTAGGGEAASVPMHSVPYHIHSAITPLNGTPGHRHPQAVLQYSPQAGSLPYPSIVAAVNHSAQSITDTEVLKQQTAIKRSHSPNNTQTEPEECESPEPPTKRLNLNHHNLPPPPSSTYHHPRASSFAYPTSMFGAGGFSTSSMTSVTELGSVMSGYYGGPQMLTSVPYHSQIGHHFRNQSKMSFLDESDNCIEQPLSANNTEEVSNKITFSSPAYLKYTSGLMSYPYPELPDRDLEKVRSPESIISNTSDYGSMTSQSPPSAFEKPNRKENLTLLSNNGLTYNVYTDLSISRPTQAIHNTIDKDLDPLDHRFAFPNVIWGYNTDNSSISQLSAFGSAFTVDTNPMQHYFNDLRNAKNDQIITGNDSGHTMHLTHGSHANGGHHLSNGLHGSHPTSLVSAPQSGQHMSDLQPQPQTASTADIPSHSSSSPISTQTVSPIGLSSSSHGVGRAAGYATISSAIGKPERTTGATAQNSN